MGCLAPNAPNPRNVGKQYLKLISGFTQGLPILSQAEGQYKPGFVNQALGAAGQSAAGLTDIYGNIVPDLAGATNQANTMFRGGNILDVGSLGPLAAQAVGGVNPGQTNLLNQLTNQANIGLQQGTALDPSQ